MGYPGDSIQGVLRQGVAIQIENTRLANSLGEANIGHDWYHSNGDASGTPWICSYCGGVRLGTVQRCEGCGASRSAR